MIKLIVTDMDGTLLRNDGTFPPNFGEVFQALQERNILFCVASGRQYDTLLEYFQPYQNQMAFISENGGYAVLKGEELYQEYLDKSQIQTILSHCESIPDIGAVLCGKKGAYLNSSDRDIQEFFFTYYPHCHLVEDLENIDDIIFKIAIYDKKGSRNNSYFHLKNLENFKVVISSDKALDICLPNINKGNTLHFLQEKLNISPEETMLFGDYLNDLEMMKMAKYSFAMKNAEPEVIEVSNFITTLDNNENGVLHSICQKLNIPLSV